MATVTANSRIRMVRLTVYVDEIYDQPIGNAPYKVQMHTTVTSENGQVMLLASDESDDAAQMKAEDTAWAYRHLPAQHEFTRALRVEDRSKELPPSAATAVREFEFTVR